MTELHTAEQIRAVPPDVPLRDADDDLFVVRDWIAPDSKRITGGCLVPLNFGRGVEVDAVVNRQALELAIGARLPLTPLRPEPTEEAWDTLAELLSDGLDGGDAAADYAVATVRAWLTEATR